jgi:POT family proton-dependent oligopeptide transporter
MAHSNKGLVFATAISIVFGLLYYTVPVFGAWWADARVGRFKAIIWGVLIGAVGHVILAGGAAPALLKAGKGLAPFIVSYGLLSIGAGIIKPLIAPILLDQLEHQKPYTKTLKSGEKVLVDPEITIQRILILFYGFINIGAFFAIITTCAEKYAGFWVAFLLCVIAYLPIPFLLIFMNKHLIKKPVVGSEMVQFFKIIGVAIKGNKWKLWGRDYWDAARPATLAAKGHTVTWTDKSVADVYRTLEACRVFLYMPLHGTTTNAVGFIGSYQAAAMTSGGIPNDLLANLNPLVILLFTPILCYGIYPFLNRRNIKFGRIDRITFGFLMAAISAALAAIVQWHIYKTSPCTFHASTCSIVSPISIWWQVPYIILSAISEMFVNVTGYELAYARAPPNMKSLVMAMFLVTNAIFITLASFIIPLVKDPNLIVSIYSMCTFQVKLIRCIVDLG